MFDKWKYFHAINYGKKFPRKRAWCLRNFQPIFPLANSIAKKFVISQTQFSNKSSFIRANIVTDLNLAASTAECLGHRLSTFLALSGKLGIENLSLKRGSIFTQVITAEKFPRNPACYRRNWKPSRPLGDAISKQVVILPIFAAKVGIFTLPLPKILGIVCRPLRLYCQKFHVKSEFDGVEVLPR